MGEGIVKSIAQHGRRFKRSGRRRDGPHTSDRQIETTRWNVSRPSDLQLTSSRWCGDFAIGHRVAKYIFPIMNY